MLRFAWLIVGALAVVVSVVGIPARVEELHWRTFAVVPLDKIVTLSSELLIASVFFCAAGVIAWHAANRLLGLALAITLAALGAVEAGMSDALINPEVSPVWQIAHWPVLLLRWVALVGSLLLLYTFPNGRFTPRWTKLPAAIWVALVTAWLVAPDLPFNAIYGPTWRRTPIGSFVVSFSWFACGILAQVLRYRRAATSVERQQIKWWAVGCSAAFGGFLWYYGIWLIGEIQLELLPTLVYWTLRPAGLALLMALLPVCLAIAILRYQLLDIDLVINRALVYGALSACVIGLYVLLVGGMGWLARGSGGPLYQLVVTCAIALLVHPLRDWLQRAVNHLLYGERDEPYAVLSRLNRRLEVALSADSALPTIVETVARALKLPYVAIALYGGQGAVAQIVAYEVEPEAQGQRNAIVALPLTYQGAAIGELRLALRGGEDALLAADRRLLEDLALQAGIIAHDARLSADLQQSRERLVSAREEERRRIRRDLHDGLGPTLASLSFRIDAARNLLRRDPEQAEALLSDATGQIQQTIADVRRLVYALRPPALDELGLVAALRQHVDAHLHAPTRVMLHAPTHLPPLSAAVEVATYRIALEALTNVFRHAHAATCVVRIAVEQNQLLVEVVDNGIGVALEYATGVGLAAMRERAAEVGGACSIEPTPGGGTTVRAQLPLHTG
jgi:signal transduction histidine kinase